MLPPRAVEAYRTGRRVLSGEPTWPPVNLYEQLYQIHTLAVPDAEAVGRGSYDQIGAAELAILQHEGMLPTHTLLDFGCGTGRLAVHAIPALPGGHYIGLDVSHEMVRRLGIRLEQLGPQPCRVSLVHQPGDTLPLPDASTDVFCAFSVFTHIEHEDTYRYLKEARRVVKPGGRVVFSCLAMESTLGRTIFLESASVDVQARWQRVRNVCTSRDLMAELARLAGWTLVRWYPGDEKNIPMPDGDRLAFGQSIGILE